MKTWTRRGFLGVAIAVPAGAIVGCGSAESDTSRAASGSTTGAGGAGGAGGGTASSAGGSGAGGSPPGTTGAGGAGTGGAGGGPSDQHVCSPDYPRIDLKADCDAVGDGQTNDNAALRKAAKIIQQAGGGELTIPPGVYIVGKQTKKTDPNADPNQGPFYAHDDMFTVSDLACLKISGYGATLRVQEGLHYGGFDPNSGQPADWPDNQHPDHAAEVGRVIDLARCDNVLIEGLEIDGSNQSLIIGGKYGNADIQGAATGLSMNMCQNVTIVDVHTHHHGLDGVTVRYSKGAPPKKMPHTLKNVVSEYNGRQGLSWIGGWGLYCTDCKFNHTGRATNTNTGKTFHSLPGAGVDIEPNAGTTQVSTESVFTNCDFVDNFGNALEVTNGTSSNHTFVGCTFWGTHYQSMQSTRPDMTFKSCTFHGTFRQGHPTMKFEGCTFEDKAWTNGQVYLNGALVALVSGYDGMTFTDCTFVNHKVPAVLTQDANAIEVFDSCTFVHGATNLAGGAAQSKFAGSKLKSCHFEESADVSSGGKTYIIGVNGVVVAPPSPGDPATHVDGPKVKWKSTGGATGDIAPGTY